MTRLAAFRLNRAVTWLLLLIILGAGLLLRVWNVNFDRGMGSHPDERSTACFYATTLRLPASWDEFWDPHQSPMNPLWDLNRQERRSFTYGHLPLYLGTAAGDVLHQLAPVAEAIGLPAGAVEIMARADSSCDAIAVAGRLTIALLDTLTIWLLFLLGVRMAGRGAGLLAAAFYAFTAQAVQLSHFFAMDPASTTFTVLAVLGGVWMVQDRRLRAGLLTGLGIGLAVASKFSAAPLLVVPLVAAVLAIWREGQPARVAQQPGDGRAQLRAVGSLLTAWVVAGVVFFVTSPYAILDWQNFAQATLVEQGAMVRGVADMPFTRQYRNTVPYLYFLQQQFQWGLGYALGLVVALGSGYALFELVRSLFRLLSTAFRGSERGGNRRWLSEAQLANLVIWSWVIPYFGLTGAFLAKFNRYMSPLLPFAALWGAWLIAVLWAANWSRRAPETSVTGSPPGPGMAAQPDESTTSRANSSVIDALPLDSFSQPQAAADDMSSPELSGDTVPIPVAHVAKSAPTRTGPLVFLSRLTAILLALLGIGGGLFWSAAYVNGVYNQEHTWITASRWIYENAVEGSVILWEQWDDPLPKSIPGEPGMDMGSQGLVNIDWGPYEEDTAEKFATLRQKLQEADYVAYSSKRIYDSVDELPQRYPMTNLYYQAMRDGRLGFELAAEFTSPPQLLGLTFEDRSADESWSLYDHPQVSIFHKVRDLSDEEFATLFDRTWERAVPYYRGQDSPLSPFLNVIGLGSAPESEHEGLLSRVIGLFTHASEPTQTAPEERRSLMLDVPLATLPVVDNYRWNVAASTSTPLAILWWWLVLAALGWVVWPLVFVLCTPLRDRGYFLSRTFGWLLAGWLLWILVNLGLLRNLVVHAWVAVGIVAVFSIVVAVRQRRELGAYLRRNWLLLAAGEVVFAAAYGFFLFVRLQNPDLWQPWFGGEKTMEFAFLNGILRSPSFPPVDPHFAGGVINYYYFGLYLVAYLIKLTGIYAEVAFNLTIATLFALTVINVFAVAYSATQRRGDWAANDAPLPWTKGFAAALLAPLFVTVIGNLDGFAQVVRTLAGLTPSAFQSALPGLKPLVDAGAGLQTVVRDQAHLASYDFWGPSRVITPTINEFPYWSFLFADLHPHLIGIPLAGLFLGLMLVLIERGRTQWRWPAGLALLGAFALLLGALAAVNLWELPTYLGLGLLALLVSQFWGRGKIHWLATLGVAAAYIAGAFVLFLPFFRTYVNVGASGFGLAHAPDPPEQWLLVWGFLAFMFLSWLFFTGTRPARAAKSSTALTDTPDIQPAAPAALAVPPVPQKDAAGGDAEIAHDTDTAPAAPLVPQHDARQARSMSVVRPAGVERAVALFMRRFDDLPQAIYLHERLVRRPTFLYLLILALIPLTLVAGGVALLFGWIVLALCLAPLGLGFALLWRRGQAADAGGVFATLIGVTGLALLAGTQVLYLRDFLDGSDYYRMNTLFKFFSQVWVIWGVMAAVAAPRLFHDFVGAPATPSSRGWRRWPQVAWGVAFALLLGASLAYPLLGTPARVEQRMPGWRPPTNTLNGLDFMREGTFSWPDQNNSFELRYEWEALQWVLQNVRGNATILESSEVDYYRAGGTRMASYTGLSGLRGMHEQEQRYPEDVGQRDGLHRELWTNPDLERTRQLMNELQIDLVYVGQLEHYLHPEGAAKFAELAAQGLLTPVFTNERATLYAVSGRLQQDAQGVWLPVSGN